LFLSCVCGVEGVVLWSVCVCVCDDLLIILHKASPVGETISGGGGRPGFWARLKRKRLSPVLVPVGGPDRSASEVRVGRIDSAAASRACCR